MICPIRRFWPEAAALTFGETHSSWRMATPNTLVRPYLFFGGRCEEALEFYRNALGAEVVMLSRFKDAPDPGMAQPGDGGEGDAREFSHR